MSDTCKQHASMLGLFSRPDPSFQIEVLFIYDCRSGDRGLFISSGTISTLDTFSVFIPQLPAYKLANTPYAEVCTDPGVAVGTKLTCIPFGDTQTQRERTMKWINFLYFKEIKMWMCGLINCVCSLLASHLISLVDRRQIF